MCKLIYYIFFLDTQALVVKKVSASLSQCISNKCGNKEAPVATFVANVFHRLDTAFIKALISFLQKNKI